MNSTQRQKILVVSNRLPVTYATKMIRSIGGLSSSLDGLADSCDVRWVGWPGAFVKDQDYPSVKEVLEKNYSCTPVFLSQEEIDGYYHGFSNTSLWYLFHYYTAFCRYKQEWFRQYEIVNKKFAEKILPIINEDSLIWIHDYHLMLLPKYLRELGVKCKIGFFFHTPFPDYEIFRFHPKGKEILEGVLACDLIGFHTYSYLGNFRNSVLKSLGYDSSLVNIHNCRHSRLGVFPIGVNWKKLNVAMKSDSHTRAFEKLSETFKNRKIMLSVERLDHTKGVLERLVAIEKMLESYPSMRDQICFIHVLVPSRRKMKTNIDLEKRIKLFISTINGKYATINNTPIHFINKPCSLQELTALYRRADVALVTPFIDGMNLVAKEYIVCKKDHSGVLVLSEFAGSAQELFNAIQINPYDTDALAEKIYQIATNPVKEKFRQRNKVVRDLLIVRDSEFWADHYISSLKSTNSQVFDKDSIERVYNKISPMLQTANHRGVFLDYDGTLKEFSSAPDSVYPGEEILELLNSLSKERNLNLYIISGRSERDMDMFFPNSSYTLVAEHGLSYKDPGSTIWKDCSPHPENLSWKDLVREILGDYKHSTPGSFVEEKKCSFVWHFRRCDPEFGKSKSNQLFNELYSAVDNKSLCVRRGKMIIEVCPYSFSKGDAVMYFSHKKKFDNILCIGDDATDESMFLLDLKGLFSIKVGLGKTNAKLSIESPRSLRGLLKTLIRDRDP